MCVYNERRHRCYLLNGKLCLSGSVLVHNVVRLGVNRTSVTDAAAAVDDDDDEDDDDANDVHC